MLGSVVGGVISMPTAVCAVTLQAEQLFKSERQHPRPASSYLQHKGELVRNLMDEIRQGAEVPEVDDEDVTMGHGMFMHTRGIIPCWPTPLTILPCSTQSPRTFATPSRCASRCPSRRCPHGSGPSPSPGSRPRARA